MGFTGAPGFLLFTRRVTVLATTPVARILDATSPARSSMNFRSIRDVLKRMP